MLTANPAALRSLTNIAEKLIIDPTLLCPSGKEAPNVDRWFRAIVVALTCADTDTRYVYSMHCYAPLLKCSCHSCLKKCYVKQVEVCIISVRQWRKYQIKS